MSNTAGGSPKMTTHVQVSDYLEKAGTQKYDMFSRRLVRNLIPQGDPGYKYVQQDRKRGRVAKLVGAGGAIFLFVGAGILINNFGQSSPAANVGGGTMAIAGFGSLMSLPLLSIGRYRCLQRAISRHNGIEQH